MGVKDEALRSTYEVSKSAAAGQQCAALHQLISTQSHKLRLYEAELQVRDPVTCVTGAIVAMILTTNCAI